MAHRPYSHGARPAGVLTALSAPLDVDISEVSNETRALPVGMGLVTAALRDVRDGWLSALVALATVPAVLLVAGALAVLPLAVLVLLPVVTIIPCLCLTAMSLVPLWPAWLLLARVVWSWLWRCRFNDKLVRPVLASVNQAR